MRENYESVYIHTYIHTHTHIFIQCVSHIAQGLLWGGGGGGFGVYFLSPPTSIKATPHKRIFKNERPEIGDAPLIKIIPTHY